MKFRFFILLLGCSLSTYAQSTINTKAFLEIGVAKWETNSKKSDSPPMTNPDFQFSLLENLEFRTETRDFQPDQQEYTLRLSPSGSKKRKALKGLSEYLHQKPDFEREDMYCDAVADLQSDWLALYLIENHLELFTEMQQVLEDKNQVYSKMLGALEVDLQDLIRLQTDKSDFAIAVHDLQLEQQILMEKHGLEGVVLDFSDLVTVNEIADVLEGNTLIPNVLADAEIVYEQELLARELALERVEDKQLLDFMQVRYRGPHEDPLEEKLAVGLGFQLPFSGDKKLKIAELQLEQAELEREQKRKKEEIEAETNENQQILSKLLQSYRFYEKTTTKERQELQNLSSKVAQQEGFNPLLLLDIEERHVETQLKLLRKREDVLFGYLRFLEESERVCELEEGYLVR